jgi:hypothetical protein
MPRRITKAFFATAAAGATITTLGFAAASPAGAAVSGRHHHFTGHYFTPSGGTPIWTNANCPVIVATVGTQAPSNLCGMAGYQASGRDFRFAQALITVPNHSNAGATDLTDPDLYVALDNSSNATYDYARVGIAPCPTTATTWTIVPNQTTATDCATVTGNTSGWVVFTAVDESTTAPTITVNGLSAATEGDGILVNAYLEPTGNSVQFTTTLPSGTVITNQINVHGPTYTVGQALADWTVAHQNHATTVITAPATPAAKIRDTQFFQGRFTTVSGAQGTFNGPWTLNSVQATSNGTAPPTGTLIGQPSYLWNDGSGFNKMGDDAFGVWRFPF